MVEREKQVAKIEVAEKGEDQEKSPEVSAEAQAEQAINEMADDWNDLDSEMQAVFQMADEVGLDVTNRNLMPATEEEKAIKAQYEELYDDQRALYNKILDKFGDDMPDDVKKQFQNINL